MAGEFDWTDTVDLDGTRSLVDEDALDAVSTGLVTEQGSLLDATGAVSSSAATFGASIVAGRAAGSVLSSVKAVEAGGTSSVKSFGEVLSSASVKETGGANVLDSVRETDGTGAAEALGAIGRALKKAAGAAAGAGGTGEGGDDAGRMTNEEASSMARGLASKLTGGLAAPFADLMGSVEKSARGEGNPVKDMAAPQARRIATKKLASRVGHKAKQAAGAGAEAAGAASGAASGASAGAGAGAGAAGGGGAAAGAGAASGGTGILVGAAAAVAAVLLVGLVGFFMLAGGVVSTSSGSGDGQKLADYAIAEYEEGKAKGDFHMGGKEYKDWYGMNSEWCAMFTAYCIDHSGVDTSVFIEKNALAAAYGEPMVKERNAKLYKLPTSSYVPQPGDLVYHPNHVGIVVSANEDDKTFDVVEGNTSPFLSESHTHLYSTVNRKTYSYTGSSKWSMLGGGVVHPDYSDDLQEGQMALGDINFDIPEDTFVKGWSKSIYEFYGDVGFSNCPLRSHTDTFAKAAYKYRIDPRFFAAVSCVESGGGQAIPTGSYNAWGWAVYNGQNYGAAWSDWDTAIMGVHQSFSKNAMYKMSTIEEIGNTYCSPPGGWIAQMNYFIPKFKIPACNSSASGGSSALGKTKIISKLTPSLYHGSLPRSKVKYIMLHETEGMEGASSVINMWKNGPRTGAHFIIERDGTITQVLPLDKIAHHAGGGKESGGDSAWGIRDEKRDDLKKSQFDTGSPKSKSYAMNQWSVGIELVGTSNLEHPTAQLEALDRLIVYIDAKLGRKPRIIAHNDWQTSRSDTGKKFEKYLKNYKSKRMHK